MWNYVGLIKGQSGKQILGAQVCHQLGTSIEDFWNEYCIKHKSCS